MDKLEQKWKGRRFGRLTVIGLNRREKRSIYWNTLCDCGNTRIVNRTYLLQGARSCGCEFTDHDAGLKEVIRRYKRQAKERNLSWELTLEQCRTLMASRCTYCGTQPLNKQQPQDFLYNGIDRLDSSKGYQFNNCVPACVYCNRSKSNRTLADFEAWILEVYHHLLADRE